MKIKELLNWLAEVKKFSPNGNVYLEFDGEYYDFTGFSIDSNNDARLYLVQGDKKV